MSKTLQAFLAVVMIFTATTSYSQKTEDTMTANTDVKPVIVHMQTSKGLIILELDPVNAPLTVANFLNYVNAGKYNGTIFHRVIPKFMIQGGGFEPNMNQRASDAPIQNEAFNGLKNAAYTIAMARTNEPHSASNQFFINAKDNAFLNFSSRTPQGWGYAVFGKVIRGEDVVQAIETVPTGFKKGHQDVPVEPVIIQNVTVVE